MRHGLSAPFAEKTKRTVDVERRFDSLGENFLNAVTLHIVEPTLPAFRLFKGVQWISYLLLLAVLLIAVGGERAWINVLEAFGLSSLLHLLISIINTLFSGKGLAALGSYVLLNLFLAFRFYRRYWVLLDKASQKALEGLSKALSRAWSDCLDRIIQDMGKLKQEAQGKTAAIHEIKEVSKVN
jgi:hypothetical protein